MTEWLYYYKNDFHKPVRVVLEISTLVFISPHHMRVLIVDDNPTITSILERCFQDDYTVDSYNNYFEASERMGYIHYDIFCLDIHLSEKYAEGIELCRKARERNPDSIIIMFTASDIDSELTRQMLEAGANTFLEKRNLDAFIVQKAVKLIEEKKEKSREKKNILPDHKIYEAIQVDEEHNMLTIDNKLVSLGHLSLLVFAYIFRRPNQYIHSSEIMQATKDADSYTGMSVKAHILIIRKALGTYAPHIQNSWGGWYGFFTEPEQIIKK